MTDGYKISLDYEDSPMDLSNYLLVRTRERIVLENKISNPQHVMKSKKLKNWQKNTNQAFLLDVRKDITENLVHLERILSVGKGDEDLPVAFAANALYILERNGAGYTEEDYSKILLPLLKKKIEYLHAEGVAQAVWALSNAGIWDAEIWEGLKKHIAEKNFDYTVVKNQRWSASYY